MVGGGERGGEGDDQVGELCGRVGRGGVCRNERGRERSEERGVSSHYKYSAGRDTLA